MVMYAAKKKILGQIGKQGVLCKDNWRNKAYRIKGDINE